MKARLPTLLLALGAFVFALAPVVTTAAPSHEVPPEAYQRAVGALEKGEATAAIDELEAITDQGVVHPDVSYMRGLAYALRARGKAAEPGDLGRAAAALEEAHRLRPSDAEADKALDLVRAEVARRRSKQDKNDVVVRPSLDRVILEAFSPATWSIAAMAASAILAIGVLMRWRKAGLVHVVGAVVTPIALLATVALGPIAFFARQHAATRKPGIVVAPETRIEDEDGKPADAPVIPEASLVEVGPRKENRVLVRWGNYEGWVPWGAVRTLAVR